MHNGRRGGDVNGGIVMRAEEGGDDGNVAVKVIKWWRWLV